MRLKGFISRFEPDLFSGEYFIELRVKTSDIGQIERLKGISDLDIDISEHKEKRSLNANSYFHVLADKIAKVLNVSATESKNMLLRDYGFIDEDIKTVILKEDIDYLKIETLHLRPIAGQRQQLGKYFYQVYYVIRGSHTYDTKEMSHLIDNTIESAKALGIQTESPEKIRELKERWNIEVNSTK